MLVNVFVTRVEGEPQTSLLVLPVTPDAVIPLQFRAGWNYYATVETSDQMFGNVDAVAVEVEIAKSGFALVQPHVPDRR